MFSCEVSFAAREGDVLGEEAERGDRVGLSFRDEEEAGVLPCPLPP